VFVVIIGTGIAKTITKGHITSEKETYNFIILVILDAVAVAGLYKFAGLGWPSDLTVVTANMQSRPWAVINEQRTHPRLTFASERGGDLLVAVFRIY
jgi:hypothetical protein